MPINRLLTSRPLVYKRGERSDNQFKGNVWSESWIPSRCWFSRQELPLKISTYTNSSICWVATRSIHKPKMLPNQGSNRTASWSMTSCLQTEANNHPIGLRMACGQHVEFPSVVGFLDWNCHYKSIATKVPQDAGVVPFLYTSQKCSPIGDRTSTTYRSRSSKQYALDHVNTGPELSRPIH